MKRTRTKRWSALLAGLAMVVGLLAFAPVAKADVENPGAVTFTVESGVIKVGDALATDGANAGKNAGILMVIGCNPPAGLLPEFPDLTVAPDPTCSPAAATPSFGGDVALDGSLLLDDIFFPPAAPEEVIPGTTAAFGIVPVGNAVGLIDPIAGTLSLDVTMAVNVVLSGALTATCNLALPLELEGTYDELTGKGTVADSSFELVVGPTDCTGPSAAAVLALLPTFVGDSSSGKNVIRFNVGADPVITRVIPPGPPVVDDTAATIGLGGSATRSVISQLVKPTPTCALDGVNGGATKASSVSITGFSVSYSHDANAGPGEDTVDYTCTNSEGSDSGTLTVTILGNECEAGGPGEPTVPCGLEQYIEFEILGDVLSMSQAEAEITLETITLNGAPQVTTGSMNAITVLNKRGDGQGWDLTGEVTDFKVDGAGSDCPSTDAGTWRYDCIPGDNLGWYPNAVVAHQVVPGDVAAVVAGSDITPGAIAAGDHVGDGLGSSAQALCSAGETTSGGTFVCGTGLALVVPASAAAGNYTATLTLTLG